MKTKESYLFIACCLAFLSFQLPAAADDDDSNSETGVRISAEADKKVSKGIHVYANEEMRLNGLSSVDRFYTTIGASLKINDFLKLGLGYSAISAWKEDDLGDNYWDWRHRGFFDATGSYKFGICRFSLRERIQATHYTNDVNEYQKPQTALALRSRIKISCKLPQSKLEPYAAFEHRLALNGAEWDSKSTTTDFANSAYLGHSDVYTNRLRAQAGLEWRISKKHSLEFYGLYDRLTDKDIDSKRKSAVLKSIVTETHSNYVAFGAGYCFSF